jgi:hypothetical protein
MTAKELKDHIRKVPCLTCLIRPLCFEFSKDGWGISIEETCDTYNKWFKKYRKIYGKMAEQNSNLRAYNTIISELKKIQQEEKKTNGRMGRKNS